MKVPIKLVKVLLLSWIALMSILLSLSIITIGLTPLIFINIVLLSITLSILLLVSRLSYRRLKHEIRKIN